MAGKIFVSYRRDDARDMAARVRDRLAQAFGERNVFMDVDNLLAGQRFDRELEKALAETDVLLAIIGPRWMELLTERLGSGKRDFVRAEIAGALQREITVIPVLVERTPLPEDALPEDIHDLVLHQKHVVTHEHFGRDLAALVEAIRFARVKATDVSSYLRRNAFIFLAVVLIAAAAAVTQRGDFFSPSGPNYTAKSNEETDIKQAESARASTERLLAEKLPANELLEITERMAGSGDIHGARALLNASPLLATNGPLLFALAETYDPNMLGAWGTRGIAADVSKSIELYKRALERGVVRAQVRLDQLR